MSKATDNLMWSIIANMNWTKLCNKPRAYDTIKIQFMREHGKATAKKLGDFVNARWKDLDKAFNVHINSGGAECVHYSGDDSYDDMMHHVIGMGKETFEAVMADMTKLDDIEPVESFSYAIPHTSDNFNDYKNLDSDTHVIHAKEAVLALAEIVDNANNIGHDEAMVIRELLSRFMAIIAGEFTEAFADITFEDDYDHFNNIHPEYRAMFANYLFDAKKFLEDK